MDLWQFVCYLEGFTIRCRKEELDEIRFAVKLALYSSGSAFAKRRPPDAKKEIKEIENEIEMLLSGKTNNDNDTPKKTISDEEQIKLLKKQMKYFK